MTRTEINTLYFDWMYALVMNGAPKDVKKLSYKKLLLHLRELEFYYIMPMDGNRLEDGIDLRYRFGREHGIQDPIVTTYLDDRTCSVLEMMVALAIRCEEQFMSRSEKDNRPGEWFWVMVRSLGLDHMNDRNFDISFVDSAIDLFLTREYEPDGSGGLFRIEGCQKDLRNVEIWYQLNWYLQEYYNF